MKRAILFLIFALFLAFIIQPNIVGEIKDTSDIRVPTQTQGTASTNEDALTQRSESKATICIDAAKGGTETGYTSQGHTDEKEINLQIANKVGTLLSTAGYNVVYTRSDDSTLSNDQRITNATQQNAQYLISIQMNSSEDALMRGFCIFTQPNDTLIDLSNKMVENINTINLTQFEGLDTDHYENFPILSSNIPSILIELGYLSNTDDYNKLIDEATQAKIAEAITNAILDQIN